MRAELRAFIIAERHDLSLSALYDLVHIFTNYASDATTWYVKLCGILAHHDLSGRWQDYQELEKMLV